MRSVAGSQWHKAVQQHLATKGLAPVKLDKTEDFQFGDDRTDTSVCSWLYPVGVHGLNGSLDIAEVTSNCPGLMSKDTMGSLDIDIKTRTDSYRCGFANVDDYKCEHSPSGHSLIRVDWFGDLSELDPQFFLETADPNLRIRKGTAKRLRKAATLVTDIIDTAIDSHAESDSTAEPETSVPTDTEASTDSDWEDGVCCITGVKDVNSRIPSLMEICTSTMRMTTYGAERGWNSCPPITIESGFDLTTSEGISSAWDHLCRHTPDVICIAFPCDPWSTWQRINKTWPDRKARIEATRRAHRRLIRFIVDVIAWQVARGGHFLLENPECSDAWKLPELRAILNTPQYWTWITDMCQYNLVDPRTQLPMRKSTRLVSDCEEVYWETSHKCQKDHEHDN